MRPQPLLTDSWTDAEAADLLRALPPMRRAKGAPDRQPDCQKVLARTVGDEVVPRLLQAKRSQKPLRASKVTQHPDDEQVAELTFIVLGEDQGCATADVGISVACSAHLEALATDIRAIRARSRNRNVGILVGGPPFIALPELAIFVGADATASDGRQAVAEAQSLLSLRAHTR